MAVGDQADVLYRLKSLVPPSWFKDASVDVDAVLSGIAESQALIYALTTYADQQARISTSTDGFLELTSLDYFGLGFPRRTDETDAAYSKRIIAEIFRPRVTRAGIKQALKDLTGNDPLLFEPWNTGDCGAYGVGTLAYAGSHVAPTIVSQYGGGGGGYGVGQFAYVIPNVEIPASPGAGCYGSLEYPFQIFVTAYRPSSPGIPLVSGYGSSGGGYGVGSSSYIDLSQVIAQVPDQAIYDCVAKTKAAGILAWVAIESGLPVVAASAVAFEQTSGSEIISVF